MTMRCSVCKQKESKYKCASCKNTCYCSSACYVKHQAICAPHPQQSHLNFSTQPELTLADISFPPDQQKDEQQYGPRVTQEQYEALVQSSHIRGCLRSVALQKIIKEIDGSSNRAVALQKFLAASEDFNIFVNDLITIITREKV